MGTLSKKEKEKKKRSEIETETQNKRRKVALDTAPKRAHIFMYVNRILCAIRMVCFVYKVFKKTKNESTTTNNNKKRNKLI